MAEAAKAQNQSPAAPGARVDPFRSYDWKVLIDGQEAHFMECSGIDVTVETICYSEGGDRGVERKLPGRVAHGSITFQRGLTNSKDHWAWFRAVPTIRKTISILMMAPDGVTENMRWTLHEAWPKAYRAAPLKSGSSAIAVHSLVLEYESLDQD